MDSTIVKTKMWSLLCKRRKEVTEKQHLCLQRQSRNPSHKRQSLNRAPKNGWDFNRQKWRAFQIQGATGGSPGKVTADHFGKSDHRAVWKTCVWVLEESSCGTSCCWLSSLFLELTPHLLSKSHFRWFCLCPHRASRSHPCFQITNLKSLFFLSVEKISGNPHPAIFTVSTQALKGCLTLIKTLENGGTACQSPD